MTADRWIRRIVAAACIAAGAVMFWVALEPAARAPAIPLERAATDSWLAPSQIGRPDAPAPDCDPDLELELEHGGRGSSPRVPEPGDFPRG